MSSEGEFQTASKEGVDYFKEKTGLSLHEQYMKYHPQVLSRFQDELERCGEENGKQIQTLVNSG
jgi:hypothetical protein